MLFVTINHLFGKKRRNLYRLSMIKTLTEKMGHMFRFVSVLACGFSLVSCQQADVSVTDIAVRPLLDETHPDCADIQFGFEGGDLHKIDGIYHLVLTERFGEMVTVNNRFGYWQSRDGISWQRISTLLQFEYNTSGKTPNACIFSPKLVFSEEENRWLLFYIQFKSDPERTGADGWYKRYDGRVMSSFSQNEGMAGIAGPYGTGRVVFERSEGSSWEGLQGITGFCPYQVDGKWFALYGSANTEIMPCRQWRLSVAAADRLAGTWAPAQTAPLELPIRAEAPQILKDGDRYYALIDEIGQDENFSLLVSDDGQDWRYATELAFLDRSLWEWKELRTPIGFIKDGAAFKTLFTTYTQTTDFAPIREMSFQLQKR